MAKQPGIWGIEVGQCAFKAIKLEMTGEQVTATAFDYIEHPKILSQPDADPDQLTREALAKFLERNSVRGDTVVLGVPGQSGLARFVKLPPVEEKKINDIVRFEAKQQIPFPLEEVIWDFQKVGSGIVTDGFAMETEIGLFAMKRDMIQRCLAHFLEAKVEVHIVQMAPLALCNYIAYDLLGSDGGKKEVAEEKSTAVKDSADKTFKRRCVVVLDIGADGSTLVITDADRIIWQRSIPPGGNHFTRALTKEMKLTFAKAEHLKRNATKSPDLKRILAALKPVLNEFVGEVQRSLNYFTNTHRDAHIEYMMGLGNAFRLPGLQKFLAEKLQLDVRKLQKLENVEGDSVLSDPVFSNNVLSFATVYGLALQGLQKGRIQTNLLPPDIQFARLIRAKKPWAVAAAAALLIGFAGTTLGYTLQNNAVASKDVVEAERQAKELADQTDAWLKRFNEQKNLVEENQKAIKSLMAGKDERLNWLLLSRFINDALPAPALRVEGKVKLAGNNKYVVTDIDGKAHEFVIEPQDKVHVVLSGGQPVKVGDLKDDQEVSIVYQADTEAQGYWQKPAARTAYFQWWSRQAGGRGLEAKPDDEGVQDLIQINLEAVDALYSQDLKTFFSQVQVDKDYKDGMVNDSQKETPPEGKEGRGWVVEVRGYTYNRGSRKFILDTLVTKLNAQALLGEQEVKKTGEAKKATEPAPVPPTPPPASDKKDGDPKADAKKETEAKKPPTIEVEPKPITIHDRIGSKVSHVILYKFVAVPEPERNKFLLIDKSLLPELVRPGGKWVSLLGGEVGRGEMGSREVGRPGVGYRPEAPPPSAIRESGTGAKVDDAKSSKGLKRSEFVVFFVWVEPVNQEYLGEASPEGPEGSGPPVGMPTPPVPVKK